MYNYQHAFNRRKKIAQRGGKKHFSIQRENCVACAYAVVGVTLSTGITFVVGGRREVVRTSMNAACQRARGVEVSLPSSLSFLFLSVACANCQVCFSHAIYPAIRSHILSGQLVGVSVSPAKHFIIH